ncbi:MAG: hypothetical protein L0241_11590 [Planctomycetia bacterium]|nr:hypothetical protein [Planctomycetia bacterium]
MSTEQKNRNSKQNEDDSRDQASEQEGVHEPETTPAQERGERLDTGKAIARGGKEEGHVPGAEPPPEQKK